MTVQALNNPERITLHLEEMVELIQGAVITMGRQQIYGELGYPDAQTGETTFLVHPTLASRVRTPEAGQTVQVEYQSFDARFTFITSVTGTYHPTLWRLQRPNTVQRQEIRKFQRIQLPGIFREFEGDFHELINLSEGGVGIVLKRQVERGEKLRGWLDIEGLAPTAVTLSVRHTRPHEYGLLAGCTFDRIHQNDLAVLKQRIQASQN